MQSYNAVTGFLIDWYKKQMKDLDVNIRYNKTVLSVEELNGYDEVIVATGSKARKLPIKGIENAMEACDYLLGNKEVGQKVVIIGGGLTGCEIALDLHRKGKNPVIVEMKNDLIAVKGICLANSSYLREYFALNQIEVHLETGVSQIKPSGVVISNKDGETSEIEADSVIVSVGYISSPLTKKASHVHLVGDCKEIGNLRTVIWRAWDVAMKIQ